MKLIDSEVARAAIQAAAQWRLLSLLFERPRAGWLEEIAGLAQEVSDEELRQAAAAAQEASAAEYLAILGPGGPVSPREVGYRGMHDPGHVLSDIAAFHTAFDFRARAEDPIDHVAVESGFAGYLSLKLAYAEMEADAEAAATTTAALTHFLESHLRYLAAPFAQRVRALGPKHVALAAEALVKRTGELSAVEQFPDEDEGPLDCEACPKFHPAS